MGRRSLQRSRLGRSGHEKEYPRIDCIFHHSHSFFGGFGCDPKPKPNPTAKADAFKLFYRERAQRVSLSINRFALSGDVVGANAFGSAAVARAGNQREVVPGPDDNNPFGKSLFSTWKLYQAIGGRELELTLIRMFEGVVFNEAVSGHPGLTTREAFPGWTRTMDGINHRIHRSRFDVPLAPPVVYPPDLEQEVLTTFFYNVVFTYHWIVHNCRSCYTPLVPK